MDQNTLLAVLVILVLVVAIGVWLFVSRRRTDRLRDRFGEEYDRTLDDTGNRVSAEKALEEREKRVEALDIRSLTADEHSRFAEEWREVKSVFVDSPVEAVLHADRMLANMMKTVGYPMADFDRRYEDLTVDHADVARHYRAGRDIAERHGKGNASTEDMRQAMKHYEALYDHLTANSNNASVQTQDSRTAATGTTRVTDVDGDGDADIVRQDVNGDGRTDRVRTTLD
ncbi:hypothetical protein [Aurantiacibacter zhengii]|uniref:hypothetical protein n=1 Tax=Aurantiacibacter zhengii TaxID=2307003 RepID=UPI0018F36916|nr:hypothetical protein [Aurantiacibacter zhengii]